MKYGMLFALVLLSLAGCGRQQQDEATLEEVGKPDLSGVVVQARALFQIEAGRTATSSPLSAFFIQSAFAASVNIPVSVVNAASVVFSVDTSQFVIPSITSSVLDFGLLAVGALTDNKLKVCGVNGNSKCTQAMIRMYTTGVAGAGLYNAADSYGAPVKAGLSNSLSTVGLDVSGATVLQSVAIAGNKNVLRLSDFSPVPVYNMQSDFTNAGAGSYATTLVLEYALVP